MSMDWLNLLAESAGQGTIKDRLDHSPFDEQVEIDVINDHIRNIYHAEGKFFVPVNDASWMDLFRYASGHMIHPDDLPVFTRFMDPETLPARLKDSPVPGVLQAEYRYKTLSGRWLWTWNVMVSGAQNGVPEGIVYHYIYDIQQMKDRESGFVSATPDAAASVHRDEQTGLLLEKSFFAAARERVSRLTGRWCLIAIDIEHFKLFLEWHGQVQGQFLLARIGEILSRVERECGGLAGFIGHDDFCLLAPFDMERIQALYEEIRQAIVSCGDSVGFLPIFGIGMIEDPTEQIMDVYNHAALTAEQIKGDFRNRIQVYNPDMHKKTAEEYRLLSEFQRGMENHEIFFCLQPQCRVSTGSVVGAESLARWRLPDGRMVPPAVFVPVLEKYGMVTNLDKYIWEEVCRWLRRWLDAGHKAVPISVNVSQIDIFTIDVPEFFASLIRKYDLITDYIKIEITESAYVDDTARVRETVRRLRETGFLVLMDDFGSGYSSLNMLRSLNVDIIKLDAQFLHIKDQESRKGISILESIVNMAKTMTIPIIVEGVETQEQINFLSDLGCRYMQGYYFHRPMPVEEFEALISDERHIDLGGFVYKSNEQIHTRELLDENVFSDAMLNNILGPVAIYRWDGASLDIIRYNQQFYTMVGIDVEVLEQRRRDILNFFYPDDREKMKRLMERATQDRLNGAEDMVRVFKPNGALHWFSMRLYFMEKNETGTLYYGAMQDVTEMQFINADLPGGYHRVSVEGGFRFLYISSGFEEMTGFTRAEIVDRFDNCYINMVHPDDHERLQRRAQDMLRGNEPESVPYRLKRKGGGWIYVINQTLVTDLYGEMCFMSVAVDVTELTKLRNQMRLLSRFSTDSIIFMRRKHGEWRHYVVVHGLEGKLGMSAKTFEKAMNDKSFYSWVQGDAIDAIRKTISESLRDSLSFDFSFEVRLPATGETLKLHMKADHVNDESSKVEYICSLREV